MEIHGLKLCAGFRTGPPPLLPASLLVPERWLGVLLWGLPEGEGREQRGLVLSPTGFDPAVALGLDPDDSAVGV